MASIEEVMGSIEGDDLSEGEPCDEGYDPEQDGDQRELPPELRGDALGTPVEDFA